MHALIAKTTAFGAVSSGQNMERRGRQSEKEECGTPSEKVFLIYFQ